MLLASTSFLGCKVEALRKSKTYSFCQEKPKKGILTFRIKKCLRSFGEKL